MAKTKLSDGELIGKVEAYESSSYGIYDAKLSEDRAKAFQFYNGEPFGNELEGRSQVISRDVLDVVEAALPQILKVFVSGDEIVRFDPRGPEDEKAAEQETAAVNYYTLEKNDGFSIFYTWFKDALLSKNGYVKAWWEEEDETETESYQGLTDDQLAMLAHDDRIEILEHTAYPDPTVQQQMQGANPAQMMQAGAPMLPPPMLHDVKISITESKGCIKIDNVAPEDMLVGVNTRTVSLQESTFVQHRALMSESEIRENGWTVPESGPTGDNTTMWEEANARNLYDEINESKGIEEYLVKDTYMDVDGDLLRLVIIGNEIVHREDAEIIPFACLTPHIMPHRHIGLSYADLTMDIQLQKSTLLRGMFDAQYLANQPRFGISDKVNLEDMLTSRPGGVVRVAGDPAGNIMPLVTPSFPQTSFQLMEYVDVAKERRTGVAPQNPSIDTNALNKTAAAARIADNNEQERINLVCRCFANTGVKELFMLVHRMVRKYNTRPEIIRLRNEWVNVDPREWKERKDMSVAVGLGTGNKDQQLMHLSNLYQQQIQLLQLGVPCVTPENIYETLRQTVMNAGFKRPEQFVTAPSKAPPKPPPPPDPKIAVAQMQLQADAQKFQAQTQVDKEKADREYQDSAHKFQAETLLEQQKADRDWKQEQLRSNNDYALQQQKIESDKAIALYKIDKEQETALLVANLHHQTAMQSSAMKANQSGAVQ